MKPAQTALSYLFSTKFSISSKEMVDRAHGTIFGAFIGDSIGSYLEFLKSPKPSEVEKAMKMPGGGTAFNFLQPGQVTDDSELAISLGNGIINSKNGMIDPELIADQYSDWVSSNPFDIGNTTLKGLRPIRCLEQEVKSDLMSKRELALASYKSAGLNSNANGGLMRSTPLGLLSLHLERIEDLRAIVKMDHLFTHPHVLNIEAATTYILAINCLIKTGDPDLAISTVLEYIETRMKSKESKEEILNSWWKHTDPKNKEYFTNDSHSIGWVKIAWTAAFRSLRIISSEAKEAEKVKEKRKNYREIIKDVVSFGGDTDTNACIVGGLIGAYFGLKGIPEEFIQTQKNLKLQRRKPYHPFENGIKIIQGILEMEKVDLSLLEHPKYKEFEFYGE